MYNIGDLVKINDIGEIYPLCSDLFIKFGFKNLVSNDWDCLDLVGKIMGIVEHNGEEILGINFFGGKQVAICSDGVSLHKPVLDVRLLLL